MEFFSGLMWLFVILAIVAIGFFTALILSSRFAKQADQAWPDVDTAEAEATSATHH